MNGTWSAGISAVHIESGGVMRLCLVNPSEQGEILFAAMAGDPLARCLRRLIKQTTFQIKRAPRRKLLCAWFVRDRSGKSRTSAPTFSFCQKFSRRCTRLEPQSVRNAPEAAISWIEL